jgi:predicted transcriptional regulator
MDYYASAVMTPNVLFVTPEMTIAELEERFTKDRVTGYPVIKGEEIIGVVSRSDLIQALANDITIAECDFHEDMEDRHLYKKFVTSIGDRANTLRVEDIMSRKLYTVRPNDHLVDAADIIANKRVHRVFVLDGHEVVGVITPFDFAKLYANGRIRIGSEASHRDF